MQFWSKYRHARYVVTPSYHELVGPNRRMVYGLAAVFEENLFDSELEQKRLKWTDQDREEVEQTLLNHVDYGRTLRRVDEKVDVQVPSVADIQTCLFMVTIDGEVDTCGRPSVSEDGYCQKHAAMQDAPRAKPNAHVEEVSA